MKWPDLTSAWVCALLASFVLNDNPDSFSSAELALDHSLDVPIGGPQGETTDVSLARVMEFERYFQTQLKK